jgi:hyperosmotically inducible periplasmic protein
MMNSQPTSKIVVGIGLAAVFGIGVSVYVMHAKHESQVARDAPAPATALGPAAAQPAPDGTAPAQSAATQTPTDQGATATNMPPAVPPAIAPAPVAPTAGNVAGSDTGAPAGDESKAARSKTKARKSDDTSGTRVASSHSSTKPADAQQAPAPARQETATSAAPAASSSEPVAEPVASDSQITTQVKSEIATATPNSNVSVTTTDGVVALAGSVSSQDAIDQARQAAQRVAGVKHVDASALTVSNQ